MTWYLFMDEEGNVDPAWMARVHEVVDYVIHQDVAPREVCVQMKFAQSLLGVSSNGGGVNAGYGGVDEEGEQEPSSRTFGDGFSFPD